MLQVTIEEEGETSRTLSFAEGERVTFGRAPENDIVLRHNSISRAHGEFAYEAGAWRLLDRGSRAGMIVVRGRRREHLGQGLGECRSELSGGEDILILGTRMHIDIKSGDATESAPPLVVSRLAETQLAELPVIEHPTLRDSRHLELLLELAKDLNGESQLEQVLTRVGRTVFSALDHATQFTVCVPDARGAHHPEFATSRDGSRLRVEDIAISQSIVERVVDNQSAMLFQTGDRDFDPTLSMIARDITSSMAVPLLGGRGPVGVMLVDNRTLGSCFAESDLELMIMLANSAAFALERAQLHTQIEVMFEGFVHTAVTAIEARDPITSGHSRRVAALCVCLAEAVDAHPSGEWAVTSFDENELTQLAYSALLHDFGKVGIPECVLGKAGKLYPEQLAAIGARFELIRSLAEAALLRECFAKQPAAPADEVFAGVAARLEPLSRDLDDFLVRIREISAGDEVDDDTVERIRAFAARSFIDPHGATHGFLTPLEVESLRSGPGTLTEQQRREVERHVGFSFDVVRQIPWPSPLSRVPDLVHAHHEKLDGSGYPRGLRGIEIPVEARVLTICDMFDAVTSFDRPYRAPLPLEGAIEFLRWEAGAGRLDRDLVDLFAERRVYALRPASAKLRRVLQLDD